MLKTLRLAVCAGILVSGATAVTAETTMRGIAFIPHKHPVMIQSHEWVKRVNAALKGKLKINYIGGPEVIKRYQQWDAVKNGVMDIIFAVFADVQDRLPGMAASWLSKCTLVQERKTGAFAMMQAELEKMNIKLIGRVQWSPFYLWVNNNPKKLADLKGLKMRTGSLYDKMMLKLGMVPVTMNSPAVYTALERGVVDGFGWPNIGPRQRGWVKKAKWVIDLPFFHNSNMGALMNLDSWKKLPADVRKTITEVTIKYEPEMVAFYKKQAADEWKKLDKVVKRVKFSAAENKMYIDAAYETEWAKMTKRIGAAKVAKWKKVTCN